MSEIKEHIKAINSFEDFQEAIEEGRLFSKATEGDLFSKATLKGIKDTEAGTGFTSRTEPSPSHVYITSSPRTSTYWSLEKMRDMMDGTSTGKVGTSFKDIEPSDSISTGTGTWTTYHPSEEELISTSPYMYARSATEGVGEDGVFESLMPEILALWKKWGESEFSIESFEKFPQRLIKQTILAACECLEKVFCESAYATDSKKIILETEKKLFKSFKIFEPSELSEKISASEKRLEASEKEKIAALGKKSESKMDEKTYESIFSRLSEPVREPVRFGTFETFEATKQRDGSITQKKTVSKAAYFEEAKTIVFFNPGQHKALIELAPKKENEKEFILADVAASAATVTADGTEKWDLTILDLYGNKFSFETRSIGSTAKAASMAAISDWIAKAFKA